MVDENADENPSVSTGGAQLPRFGPDLDRRGGRCHASGCSQTRSPAMVEQCRDPAMIRWTTVPNPSDGYQLRDAEEFLALTALGWASGERLGWTIEAQRGSERGFCGSIDLRLEGNGSPRLALACILRRAAARS